MSEPITLITVVDLETTGFEPPAAGVCEVGYCDVVPTEYDLLGAPSAWRALQGHGGLINPGHAIPAITSAIHQIVDEDVAGAETWSDFAPRFFGVERRPRVYAAHNAKFERQFITDELTGGAPWICTYKVALRLWPEAPGHSNQALRHWLKLPVDRKIADVAHRAHPDAYVTAHIVVEQLKLASIEQMIAWTAEPALQFRCYIGKWRGTPWREVDDGFLYWILGKDFDEDVVFTVRHELDRREKERQTPTSPLDEEDEVA